MLLGGLRIAGVLPQADPQVDQVAKQLSQRLNPTQQTALRNVGKLFIDAGAQSPI